MNRLIYLDNASTTRVHPEVAAAMAPFLGEAYGNASSLHAAGRGARKALEDARAVVARHVNASPQELVFTSGGTEADNLAIIGVARARRARGTHVVVSAVEHPAVLHAADALRREGFRVSLVSPDAAGRVSPDAVERAFHPDTVLVSVMLVNNEVGTVQPVAEIARRARARGAVMHTDAVQALGHLPVDVAALGVDLLSVSAHKLHGPKGVGALVVRKGVALEPLQVGGPHEWQRRAGTENVAGIAGFAAAVERAHRDLPGRAARMRMLRDRLEAGIVARIERMRVNGMGATLGALKPPGEGGSGRGPHPSGPEVPPTSCCAPHILNVSFAGAEGESILISLDAMGVCVSTGSACSSGSTEPSHVLTAMGLPLELAQGSIRLSVSEETTEEEVDYAVGCLAKAVTKLRAISATYETIGLETPRHQDTKDDV